MALTRVQPSAIDSSQNYSVNTLSANTVLDGGIEIISIANGAFLQANSAYDAANSAFAKANVPSGITYTTSNNAPVGPKLGDQWYNTYNNILFEYISDGTTNLWIDVSSTTITSNVGYATDTVAQNLAISAFASANNNAAVNTTQNTNITLVGNFANGAFGLANTNSTTLTATQSYANGAFVVANGAASFANGAFVVANGAASFANGAFGLANTNTTNISTIQGVDTTQNTNISLASSYANGAFTKANSALANTTGTFAGDLTITGNTTVNGLSTLNNRIKLTHTPATGVNAAIEITAANTKGGAGYADVLWFTNTSGGTTNPNKFVRVGPTGTFEIINSAYTSTPFSITDNGDLTISGNTTFNGIAPGYSPNRPGFRVYGNGTTNIDASASEQILTSTNWAVDWSQGSYLNGSTGVFTAPIAGLYSVCITVRTQLNNYAGLSSIGVRKTTGGTNTMVCYVEFYNNTTMNHTGSSSIVKLAAGDTLKLVATTGKITFDLNDNWSVAYLG